MWQFDGQWCRIRLQDSEDAGRGPSWASVAPPANVITSPTRQVVPVAGAVIVAAGAVLPTLIVTADVAEAPRLSVTRRLATNVPLVE